MKYVIRYTANGIRVREYFASKRAAEQFARHHGLPQSQIKVRE